ncbi:YdcF family protein [Paenibacillus sp. J2TS4]|uniref:YdcF family protein n=1 Tax=Paenibacillus sp. J2TS4 TaxID=2807194 RepID=UPI001B1B66EB|nr:YdcF family protein [Paenibacillus sp. J2TS4]GIP33936.1 hypothetical protein J2TS4_31460 [Paenibacillus sp. J2TS4]
MFISKLDPDRLTRQQMTQLLFDGIRDDGKKGDCIFLFGSRSSKRVMKAADLYKAGRAPYILLSGGTRWGEIIPPEAERMRDQIVRLGVPESALLLEAESNHTGENVIASMLVLSRSIGLHKIRRLLVVTSPYHMRRCHLTLLTYMPRWIAYTLCPDERHDGQANNWWMLPKEKERVAQEARSLIRYVKEGMVIDTDLSID